MVGTHFPCVVLHPHAAPAAVGAVDVVTDGHEEVPDVTIHVRIPATRWSRLTCNQPTTLVCSWYTADITLAYHGTGAAVALVAAWLVLRPAGVVHGRWTFVEAWMPGRIVAVVGTWMRWPGCNHTHMT